jgi:hypothetical protein
MGSAALAKTIGIVRVTSRTAVIARGRVCRDDIGLRVDQLLRERPYPIDVTAAPTKVHPHVAAIVPTRKRLSKRRIATLPLRIIFIERHEHADSPYAVCTTVNQNSVDRLGIGRESRRWAKRPRGGRPRTPDDIRHSFVR